LTHEDIKMAIADAQYLWHAYLRTEQEDVLPVLLAGDQTTAKFFIHGLQKRRYDRFLDEVDAALHTIQLRVEEVEKHAAQTVVYSTFLLGGASLLLGVVLVLGSLALIASITSPLRDLTMAARQVARGDIDQQVSYQATNEIGILADAIRQLIAYTKQNVVLQQVVEERRVALEQSNHQLQREIDEHKQTERMLTQYTEELKAAHAAAEAANQAKSMFLANMSHELRTPLHAILSFADFGLDKVGTAPTEKLRYYFTHIDQCGKVLLTLVNALLDLAKLEAGKMTFEFEHTDLSILVTAVTDEFISLTAERRLTIRLLSSEGTIEVCLDATKIMQVLRNLLSNAVKFSPDGGTIEISIRREVQSIVVAIRDQGMGVPEGELETIFDKFIQSSRTRTGAGGTGLGLSICREIIAAHQGRIWAENAPAGGAVFSFELPLSAPHGTGTEPALVGARGAARL
jgi:signal transduction histidine kinase